MIHAFLFVLNVREGNGGHGPSFKKIMEKINRTAGTNISVYHTFHDEVNLYKTHVWRCNGICQHRQPFFGYIRRTCNRAPGPNDQWWATHQQTCGGYFKKTSEPEPKKKGGAGAKAPTVQSTSQQNINHPKWGLGDTKIRAPPAKESRNTIGGNLTNVHGFNDSKPKSNRDLPATIPQSGGHSLGGGSSKNVQSVRDVWSTKFVAGTTSTTTTTTTTATTSDLKMLDDDIGIFETINPIIDLCDDQSDEEATALPVPRSKLTPNERQSQIKAEIMDIGDNDSEIELIDDDYDDELANTTTVLGDTSVIDDIFGSDTLLSEFNDVNGAVAGRSCDVPFEIISCPICPERMRRDQLLEHLNGCGGIRVSIEVKPPSHSSGVTTSNKNAKKKSTPFERQSQPAPSNRNILLESGYSEETVNQILKEQREEENYNNRIMMEMRNENLHQTSPSPPIQETKLVPCPICEEYVDERNINEHIDECLLKAED